MIVRCLVLCGCLILAADAASQERKSLPGTKPLTEEGDISIQLVEGADRFLLGQLEASIAKRAKFWEYDYSSKQAFAESIEPNRVRLAEILGAADKRKPISQLEFIASTKHSHIAAKSSGYTVYHVRWPVLGDIHAEGLLLQPKRPIADVVVLPDADQTPEMIAGLTPGLPPESQVAGKLADAGCRVLVPALIDRTLVRRKGRALLTSREFLYRSAFELGRHIIGYEVQKTLAAIDWFRQDASGKIGVFGYGEGGMLALYAAALDSRIDAVCVSGHFRSRQNIWNEPLDRNVFGLLERFGDAELATMVLPRQLIVEAAKGPEVNLPSNGGGPATLKTAPLTEVRAEVERYKKLLANKPQAWNSIQLAVSGNDGQGAMGSDTALDSLLASLGLKVKISTKPAKIQVLNAETGKQRQTRQMHEIDRHNQWLLRESPFVRKQFMRKLDTSSLPAYEKSVEAYRNQFRHEVVGHFDTKTLPFNPRTRVKYETPSWTGYEVVLDVFPDVIAYGVLIVPKDIKPGERRPVVVCQHGLEGRPEDVIQGNHRAYHDFAAKLAERGFITFAPQNLYLGRDKFRTLQRKANPLKKTLFSIIVPQHQQIVDWLETLSFVDKKRIAFYGLSYGGKSAMRIPPLVTKYCLSICSADFNEWVLKNASSRHNFSYVWTGEYEIFEWNLGSNFNYAEMAALICPRPFMVERGHFDGVGEDEWVAYEFAKVRHLYAAKLFIPDRCEIEWFYGKYKGIHTINGQGTFDFLHKHLNWPKR